MTSTPLRLGGRHGGRQAAQVFAGVALLAIGGCATKATEATSQPAMANPSRSSEDCMFSVVIKDWAAIDQQRFIIYGLTQHEPYLAKLFFPTPDLINNIGMAVIDSDHNGRICGQSSDYIQFRNATIPGRNPITSLRRITEEEARALLAESKKKPEGKKKPEEQKAPQEPVAAP